MYSFFFLFFFSSSSPSAFSSTITLHSVTLGAIHFSFIHSVLWPLIANFLFPLPAESCSTSSFHLFHVLLLFLAYYILGFFRHSTLQYIYTVFFFIPQQAEVVLGVPGRLRPRIFSTFGTPSSAKRTGRLYPRRNPWYSLLEAESTSGHMVLPKGTTEKIPSDTTGDRSRDPSTSSAAP